MKEKTGENSEMLPRENKGRSVRISGDVNPALKPMYKVIEGDLLAKGEGWIERALVAKPTYNKEMFKDKVRVLAESIDVQYKEASRIAEAHGIWARQATTKETLSNALRQSVASRKPALIEAIIDPSTYPTTPKTRLI